MQQNSRLTSRSIMQIIGKMPRLFVFDVDSTLINEEVVELIAAKAGVREEVKKITNLAMAGEIDFVESLRKRVSLLSGLPASVLDQVRSEITLTKGAQELISVLQSNGNHVAVVSGGFTSVITSLMRDLKIDLFKANNLEISDGRITGVLLGEIVDRKAKAEALKDFSQRVNVELSNTVAIGDGANDIDMLETSGLGIAFCAKPALQKVADVSINERDLMQVLKVI